jgi:hypothetical protein
VIGGGGSSPEFPRQLPLAGPQDLAHLERELIQGERLADEIPSQGYVQPV